MLNYAETASSSTNVLPTPVPCNQPQEQSAEPLPEVMQPLRKASNVDVS